MTSKKNARSSSGLPSLTARCVRSTSTCTAISTSAAPSTFTSSRPTSMPGSGRAEASPSDATREEARRALWERQADKAHTLRKQARGQDCDDLAIDLTALLLDVQRRQQTSATRDDVGVEAEADGHGCGRVAGVRSDPRGKRGSSRRQSRPKGSAASGNGRLERTSKAEDDHKSEKEKEKKEKTTIKTKTISTWRALTRRGARDS